MGKVDSVQEQFIADTLNREHRRLIAAVLNDIESILGKDKERSTMVKNVANQSMRIMFTNLTKTEVEAKDYPK